MATGDDGVVQLVKRLRDHERGEEEPCRRLYDIRGELDVLLFTHLATTDNQVTDEGAYHYVLRTFASLAYSLRQHKLVAMADGIEALVQNSLETEPRMLRVLRFLLALAGGNDGSEFVESLLGPQAIYLLREKQIKSNAPFSNQRIGDSIVQDNIDLICNPSRLFEMPDEFTVNRGMNDLQNAFSMAPGTSKLQSDIWREPLEQNVDMFGALHHTSFHRSDIKLQRFDIFMNLPPLSDTAPDMIKLAIESCSNKDIPKRLQIPRDVCSNNSQMNAAFGNDSPELLFNKQKHTVHIPLRCVPNEKDVWQQVVKLENPVQRCTWEKLASHPSQVAKKRKQITLGQAAAFDGVSSMNDEFTPKKIIEFVLLALQGLESSMFGISHDTLTLELLHERIRIPGEISSTFANWLKDYAAMGTYIIRLQALASYCQQSCQLIISSSITKFLAAQQAYTLSLQPKTIVELTMKTRSFRDCLKAFAKVFLCDKDELWFDFQSPFSFDKRPVLQQLPRNDSTFLDHAYNFVVFSQLCEPLASNLYMWLFIHASTPYLEKLSRFFFLGEPWFDFDTELPACLTKQNGWKQAILETTTLLHLIHDINPQLHTLCSSKWTSLKIDTDAIDIETTAQVHASNLLYCSSSVDDYKQTKLDALADAIIALQEDQKKALPIHVQATNQVIHKKQLIKAQQTLQRQLLDDQIASKAKYDMEMNLKRDAEEVQLLQRRLQQEQSKLQEDKAQLLNKYSNLLAKAEQRHRYLTWRQARLRRRDMFAVQLERQYCCDASEWCQESSTEINYARPLDILWSKPLVSVTGRELKLAEDGSNVSVGHPKTISQAIDVKESTPPPITTHIKILNTPSRNGKEAASLIYGDDEASKERFSVRVTQNPGGDSGGIAAALDFSSSSNYQPLASVRHLTEPGGGGTNAAIAIYQSDVTTTPKATSVKILQEPGGGGSDAEAVIYNDHASVETIAPSVRILQEPGGGGDNAAQAIYQGDESIEVVQPLIKILNVPGGGGDDAHSILYPDFKEVDEKFRPQTKILQPPGGNGNDVRNMLYSSEYPENVYKPSIHITQKSSSNDHNASELFPISAPEPSKKRSQIRILQAPGGDGEDVSDLLHTQFSALELNKSSIKILQPSGGGHDTASKLIYGNRSPYDATPKPKLLKLPSHQLLKWRMHHPSTASFLSQTTEILHGTSSLVPDFEAMLQMYLEFLENETVEHIPIDTLVEANLYEPVQSYRSFIGKVALNSLRDDMKLMEHLTALHDTMFLSGGLWVDIFIKEFINGLRPLNERVQWGAPGALNDAISSAMHEASYTLPPAAIDRFGYRTSTSLASSLEEYTLIPSLDIAVSQLDPVYQVPKALKVILPDSTMKLYSRVHCFGFYIKATVVLLRETRSLFQSLFQKCPMSPIEHRRCDLYLYCQHHVIAEEWYHYRQLVASVSDTIALRDKHKDFLKNINKRCFLTGASRDIRGAIEVCFKRMLAVCNQIQVCPQNSTESLRRVILFILDEFATLDNSILALCDALRSQRDHDGPSAVFVEELLLQLNLNDYYGTC